MRTPAEKVAVLALVAARCNAIVTRGKKVSAEQVEDAYRVFIGFNVQPDSSISLLDYVDKAVRLMFEEWKEQ